MEPPYAEAVYLNPTCWGAYDEEWLFACVGFLRASGWPLGWVLALMEQGSSDILTFLSARPSFSRLEQWLEALRMHLALQLPLSSQLEQLEQAFGEIHQKAEGGLPAHAEMSE